MKTILFVCTGNTCRSSMAEALFKGILEKEAHDLGEIQVISAGTSAMKGDSAAGASMAVMEERGLSLRDHRAKPLTKELIEEADLILTMTTNHKNTVLNIAPEAKEKVYTLKEFANEIQGDVDELFRLERRLANLDIKDPFGQPIEVYRESAEEIEAALKKLLKKLGKK